jgi:hypothetical protein
MRKPTVLSLFFQLVFPTLILFFILNIDKGQLIDRVEGAKAADVTKAVKKFAAQKSAPSRVGSSKPESEAPTSPVKKLEPLESRCQCHQIHNFITDYGVK